MFAIMSHVALASCANIYRVWSGVQCTDNNLIMIVHVIVLYNYSSYSYRCHTIYVTPYCLVGGQLQNGV